MKLIVDILLGELDVDGTTSESRLDPVGRSRLVGFHAKCPNIQFGAAIPLIGVRAGYLISSGFGHR